jgi:homoserine acetyltransferase
LATDEKVEIAPDSQPGGTRSVGLVELKTWTFDAPLALDCGRSLSPVTQAYETYGELSPQRDNAILIFHALSGDAHVAGYHAPDDPTPISSSAPTSSAAARAALARRASIHRRASPTASTFRW